MKDNQALIEKIEKQAAGERAAGNHAAAETFDAKAEKMRSKYNLPKPAAVPSVPVKQERPREASVDFPGVPPRELPLTNEQLNALRNAAAGRGALSDKERDAVLGKSSTKENSQCFWL